MYNTYIRDSTKGTIHYQNLLLSC